MTMQTANFKLQTSNSKLQSEGEGQPLKFEGGNLEFHIVAFCCHYCAYAAADLAGSLRIQHPASVRVVKIPCTGKLDVQLALDAFEHGADGVMVAGCMEGDCHYQQGNFSARRRVTRVKALLKEIGLEPDRARMFNMSSAMGKQWAEAVTEMDAQVRALGPSPLRTPDRCSETYQGCRG
jgi:coenzyme F420-reducing hydrogenase delta subunit